MCDNGVGVDDSPLSDSLVWAGLINSSSKAD